MLYKNKAGATVVFRVYVNKKPGFDVEAQQLSHELSTILGIGELTSLGIVNRYDVEGIGDELFREAIPTVFSEPPVDNASLTFEAPKDATVFAVEYLPGQFDQRAESAGECIQLISQAERPTVRTAKLYVLHGELSQTQVNQIKHYVINPVEAREASLEPRTTLKMDLANPSNVEVLNGFTTLDESGLRACISDRDLAMDLDDLRFCQRYFAEEGREPTITELKVIDTYWSDHCRHTTFGTQFDDVTIDDSTVRQAFERYLRIREELGRTNKPECLMDIATIGAKWLRQQSVLTNVDESDEVNACTVKVKVDVDGHDEDWLFLFKNETHNHPTEIEPFGGAATCIGGCIRDPLSGRSYVYQAMRVTGAGDPRVPVDQTLEGKLPQRKLVTTAAAGYSSYGNQIGLATGQVHEIYHSGYVAKRMEVGAVVGATPADHVRREVPIPGDRIILLGGKTGRDGIGGATGASKAQDVDSLEECGAEVQKGNAPIERKLQRLFRRGDACRLIKRCNDFGAGGVSVATGEIADGLTIDLDAVPKKYAGLDGTELAISESQERMAVDVAATDVDEFLGYAREENLEASVIATVTERQRMVMHWNGETIVDLSRAFLASNGAPKHQRVHVGKPQTYATPWSQGSLAQRYETLVRDINVASNKGLSERFDSTIGAGTVLMPFGGRFQLTENQAMVAKLPVFGHTTSVSGMAWGFNPYIMERNQFTGAYLSVVEAICKLVATGFDRHLAYLSLQEYFGRLRDDPYRWGQPTAAVLGALMAQLDLGVGAIGGKDSMSGSFEDLDVPPSLIAFAVATGNVTDVISPEFKAADHRLIRVRPDYGTDALTPDSKGIATALDFVHRVAQKHQILAAATPGYGATAETLFKMALGNRIGVVLNEQTSVDDLFASAYGSFILEVTDDFELPEEQPGLHVESIGRTTANYTLSLSGETLDLPSLQEVWEQGLESIFPYRSHGAAGNADSSSHLQHGTPTTLATSTTQDAEVDTSGTADTVHTTEPAQTTVKTISYTSKAAVRHLGQSIARPHVVIPVFPGNNCEYDSAAAFERAGAEVSTLVINNLGSQDVIDSTNRLVEEIRRSQIIMLPGGFSGGDEPDGSAKFIAAFFRAPAVTEAVRDLLNNRDGLMLGICNGFQALIKLGLVPYGDIVAPAANAPTLTVNTIGRHQSRLVHTRIASTKSPWLAKTAVGEIHTIAISHGEGRFTAQQDVLDSLEANGQIATQYVDEHGLPSMDLSVNPNGSALAVEGITSPDGRVFGKMAHTERFGDGNGVFINVPGNKYQPLFASGVEYFA